MSYRVGSSLSFSGLLKEDGSFSIEGSRGPYHFSMVGNVSEKMVTATLTYEMTSLRAWCVYTITAQRQMI